MPYDSVYSEKRPPGTLRTAWRKFYSDASAMVGLYGCAGLAVLCIFGGWFAPYGIDQQFLGYQLLPPSWSRWNQAVRASMQRTRTAMAAPPMCFWAAAAQTDLWRPYRHPVCWA